MKDFTHVSQYRQFSLKHMYKIKNHTALNNNFNQNRANIYEGGSRTTLEQFLGETFSLNFNLQILSAYFSAIDNLKL